MNLIDTHCHLNDFGEETETVLARAKEALVESMIACGTETADWHWHYDLAKSHPHIHYTVGMHPLNVHENWERDLESLESFFQKDLPPIAIGEIGLDFHLLEKNDTETVALQREIFHQQLLIANKKNCPIIIHARDTLEDCRTMIDRADCDWSKIVIHCFSRDANAIRTINSRGGRGSFTGTITYNNAENVRQALVAQGTERLMLETDCPYLSPVPFRSKKNEPAFLGVIATCAANLLGISEPELR
ncbi:MAG: TatD family hydrolase, partial [Puniceicoccales bacterium]|nr:TatD family hydrolase [Puniceicoccales bacterium]